MVVQELQGLLERIYDVPLAHDVAQFLLTDRRALPEGFGGRSDEQLLVAQDGAEMTLGLFLEPELLARPGAHALSRGIASGLV